ncbi:MAG: DUF2752 domain-containing protein [Opitutaceae bacterium]|nr:DUF2752 domain-containing protein [Verrucomicrobiales bacterium]
MHRDRALWAALGALGLVIAAFLLHRSGPSGLPWWHGCVFHQLTGLNCPGCGMTRAAYAMLHGRVGEAFRFNPLGMVLLPVASLGAGIEIVGWIRGKPLPFRLRAGVKGAWVIVAIIIGFGILRNLPWWPFTLLAPP